MRQRHFWLGKAIGNAFQSLDEMGQLGVKKAAIINEVSDYGKSPDIASNDLAEDPYANMGAEVSLSDDDLPF